MPSFRCVKSAEMKKGGTSCDLQSCFYTMSYLLFQKWCVDGKTGPEVSQQLPSSCIKMLQFPLNVRRYHLCEYCKWKKGKQLKSFFWEGRGGVTPRMFSERKWNVFHWDSATAVRFMACCDPVCMRRPPGESAAMADVAAALVKTCR